MKTILLSLALLISTSALAKLNLVKVSRSIVIDEKSSTVYEVFANTLNDHLWRDEVNSIVADGPFEVGTNYTEDAHIALKKNFITKVQLVELIDQELALYKTPEDAPFFLSSKRKVEQLSDGKTRATYTVEFDYEGWSPSPCEVALFPQRFKNMSPCKEQQLTSCKKFYKL